jgi:hypothetical protein
MKRIAYIIMACVMAGAALWPGQGMGAQIIWDQRWEVQETLVVSGTSALSKTINNAAAVSIAGGLVRIPANGHGFAAGSQVTIAGSVNYNGTHTLVAVAANTFDIRYAYTAETFAGTETITTVLGNWVPEGFELLALSIHLSAAPAASENFVLTLDAAAGAAYDAVIYSRDFSVGSVADVFWVPDQPIRCSAGDKINVTWANTNGRTYGLTLFYRRAR